MNIKLRHTKALTFSLNTEPAETVGEDVFNFSVASCFSDSKPSSFLIRFECSVKSVLGYDLDSIYLAEFETDEPIDQEFMDGHFPSVNAPAIAYPFLRSYVSTVTLNSGVEPMILPTINFQALAKEHQKNKCSD